MRGSAAEAPAAPADDVDVELLKAVAQAWHAQSGNPRPSRASSGGGGGGDDDDGGGTRRGAGEGAARHRPSRFKLEAMAAAAAAASASSAPAAPAAAPPPPRERTWDFARSLWDAYELVTIARKLESGLVLADHTAPPPPPPPLAPEQVAARGTGKRARESGRSLRSLFLRSSSRRLDGSKS